MITGKIIIGMVLMCLGILFFFNNKNISKGAFKFYQKMYTQENLKIMFKICGALLVFLGIILIFTK